MLSLDTRGIGGYKKRRKVFNYLKKHSSHNAVIFLQETHSTKIVEKVWINQWGCGSGNIIFSHGASDSRGVLIAFREGLDIEIKTCLCDKNGRYIILHAHIQDNPILLVNYYAPNDESTQVQALSEICDIIDRMELEQDMTIVWGGDFNLFFDSFLDADGGNPQLKMNSLTKLLSIMSERDLCDLFRVRNPDTRHFTWRHKNSFLQRRLDYFLVSEYSQEQIDTFDIIPSVQSDHSALKMKFSPLGERKRGPSHWKFNNSLVLDKDFVTAMKNKIPEFYQESEELGDDVVCWEFLKYKMHQFSMTYSKEKAFERKSARLTLEKKVKELESQIRSNSDEALVEQYNKSKNELENLYNYITEGIILRSEVNWYEYGEKSSKYFLSLEKRNKAKSHLRKVVKTNEQETSDPIEIIRCLKDFYSSLYTRRSNKTEDYCIAYLRRINIPKLTDDERNVCEGKLTKMEIWNALNSMGNNKSPGNDGFSKEFYVCLFQEIHSYLLDALNLSFIHGQLSTSQRQAMITLIEKKGKDKRFLKNWRPISLINVDAKVASKSLALRVRKVLNSLIHSDQTAYLKDRYIGESVRLISDILEYTDDNDIEAILFSADFEKAFDSIDHCFLFSVLKSLGFGPDFIQWVKTLFKNSESCVMTNGFSTGYFALERGTRQGDPLSAYLFILALEIMFIEVRSNVNIAGVKIGGHSVKLSVYADDIYFFTLDVNSLRLILNTCDKFEKYSSLKLIVEKCQACWIGSAKGTQDAPIKCNWVNLVDDKVLTLGVLMSYDVTLAEKCNFLNLITSMKDV